MIMSSSLSISDSSEERQVKGAEEILLKTASEERKHDSCGHVCETGEAEYSSTIDDSGFVKEDRPDDACGETETDRRSLTLSERVIYDDPTVCGETNNTCEQWEAATQIERVKRSDGIMDISELSESEHVTAVSDGIKHNRAGMAFSVVESEHVTLMKLVEYSPFPDDDDDDVEILDEPPRYDKVRVKHAGLDGLFLMADVAARRVVAEPLQEGSGQFEFCRKALLAVTRGGRLARLVSLSIQRRGVNLLVVPGKHSDHDVIELTLEDERDDHHQQGLFVARFISGNLMLKSLSRKGYFLSIEKRGVVLRKLTHFPPTENYLVDMFVLPDPPPLHKRLSTKLTKLFSCVK